MAHRHLLKWALLALFLFSKAWAAEENTTTYTSVRDLRMDKRFGIGASAGGPLAVLGLEIDFNINETLSISGGIGTGTDYSTAMIKARYFLLGKWVSPYIGGGFARWWSSGIDPRNVRPAVLANRFISPGDDVTQGFSVFMIYPCLGVQVMHAMGVSFFAEVQYLFKLFNFANGTYAGLGMHWYF